jgi:hypothetical protein
MVKNLFEKTVIDSLLDLQKGQGKADAFHIDLKKDIESIKTNVDDLCKRTTVLETQRDEKIKTHNTQIKVLSTITGALGVAFSAVQLLHFLKIA